MFIFYPIALRFYQSLVHIASFFSPKAKDLKTGRKNQWGKISEWSAINADKQKIWIHSASLGEYEMSKPIINSIAEKFPNTVFVLSFHSPSGFNFAAYDASRDLKIYLPLDIYSEQKKLINLLEPNAVYFIKYEFWYNCLKVLTEKDIPYFFTSLHLEKDSYIFSNTFKKLETYLRQAKGILCHNKKSKEILEAKGFQNCINFGDTRIEQVLDNKLSSRNLSFTKAQPSICFGSLCPEEVEWASNFINSNPQYNYIIAPHDVDDKSLNKIIHKLAETPAKYSHSQENIKGNIVIVDTIGDLKFLYKHCDIAYVGGAFAKGPHNLIEPLIFSKPSICGPNIKKFPMAQFLIDQTLCKQIKTSSEFEAAVDFCLELNTEEYIHKSENFLKNNKPDMNIILEPLARVLKT